MDKLTNCHQILKNCNKSNECVIQMDRRLWFFHSVILPVMESVSRGVSAFERTRIPLWKSPAERVRGLSSTLMIPESPGAIGWRG